jgi:hypothetical protein
MLWNWVEMPADAGCSQESAGGRRDQPEIAHPGKRKRRPEGAAFFWNVGREDLEDRSPDFSGATFVCTWQAWQRPTFPSLRA